MNPTRILRRPLSLALLGVALAAAAVSATETARREGGHDRMFVARHAPFFADADKNGDHALDASEWSALFATLDADHDGKVEGKEMAFEHGFPHPGFPPPEALAFMIAHRADSDADGQVTAAEWKARVAALDTDKDGALTGEELSFRHRFGDDEAALPPFAGQWDTDGDGTLAAGELDALFAAADDDHDGVLVFPRERHRRM